MTSRPLEPLPTGLAEGLTDPRAYPDDPSAAGGVRWIQTHLSHVFLTGARVYKLRKAVSFGFVDFGTRAARNADCVRELTLNRRLAPDVYLSVAPADETADGVRVGKATTEPDPARFTADPRELVLVMRRLPDGKDALSLLERGALRAHHLDAVAHTLARFHAQHRLGVPSPWSPEEWRDRVHRPVQDNVAVTTGRVDENRAAWQRLGRRAQEFAERHAAAFEARRLAGRAVDGHGDVHLQHVWFETDRAAPILIDCLEFREDLRQIDAAAEVAFLAMDLAYRGRARWAARFLRTYAAEADDFDLYRVIDYFLSYRAAVRAKVAALASVDADIAPEQRAAAARSAARHLSFAVRALAARPKGAIALVAGVVGTGKSTAAAALADATNGVVIASDRVRKHLAGLAVEDRSGAATGLYSDASKNAVYAALLDRAAAVLDGGRVAILDATYASRAHRDAVVAFARSRGLGVTILEAVCDAATARARLARRAVRGSDASDAGPDRYERSVAEFDPIATEDGVSVHRIGTHESRWRRQVVAVAREIVRGRKASRISQGRHERGSTGTDHASDARAKR
jgi:aminoglycoside phosphotransferase family enzyme/predicted kinase